MEAKSRNSPRKKLADISNLPLRKRLSSQDKIPEQIPACSKEYIERIQKENLALTKMLAERNKIIEITGVEIQKLKINARKMQQQNQLLAQANSKMLAELNSNKDRVKTLQHELVCIKGLLNVRKFEAEVSYSLEIFKLFLHPCPIIDCGHLKYVNCTILLLNALPFFLKYFAMISSLPVFLSSICFYMVFLEPRV